MMRMLFFLYLCEITNYIKMTTTENIRKELQALVDAKYKEFHSSLLPGANNILGVRIPQLRIMAPTTRGNYGNYNSR